MDKWTYDKTVRELVQNIKNYEIHAAREIKNNEVARKDKVRNNSQEYLLICKQRYKDFTGEDYQQET